MRPIQILLLVALLTPILPAETEEFRVYTEHPRLFLRPQRLKLLKRERERQSMRWRQFELLVSGSAQMPEPGFALALYYAVSGNAAAGKRAVEWALSPATDLRQLAIVYDWCQDALTEAQSKALAAKIRKAAIPAQTAIPAQRDRALAAVAIAEQDQNFAEATLRELTEKWWRGSLAGKLNAGANPDPGADIQAMLETLHAVRDNLTIDLRPAASDYLKTLPLFQVICNYPSPLGATENEYRIPVFTGNGEPDLTRATLARAAGLSMVAFDNNALECQFLQGWLIQDRFMLRGAFGAPYEFLWANPYQPGLSYSHMALVLHEKRSGTLFLRSDWDEDATWFALYEGQFQLFRDGKITVLSSKGPLGAKPEPIRVGAASVVVGRDPLRFQAEPGHLFVIGGKPRSKYNVEVDDEELSQLTTDAAGTLELLFQEDRTPGVRIKELLH
jgi:hypothetical protein